MTATRLPYLPHYAHNNFFAADYRAFFPVAVEYSSSQMRAFLLYETSAQIKRLSQSGMMISRGAFASGTGYRVAFSGGFSASIGLQATNMPFYVVANASFFVAPASA